MTRKYTNGALWRCLKAYPDAEHFKLFMGQCYIMGFTRARYMEDILREHFKMFTASQREHLLKKYDECFLQETIDNWHEFRKRLSHERLHFLYTKIKYKKIMRLNIAFNETDYHWPVMCKVFDGVFTAEAESELNELVEGLNPELVTNILGFYREVKEKKEKRVGMNKR